VALDDRPAVRGWLARVAALAGVSGDARAV